MEEEERETSRSVAVELDRSEDFDCDEVPESGDSLHGADSLVTTTRIDETGQQIIIVSGPPDFETLTDSGLGDHIERTHSTGGLEPPAKKIRIEDGQTYILAVADSSLAEHFHTSDDKDFRESEDVETDVSQAWFTTKDDKSALQNKGHSWKQGQWSREEVEILSANIVQYCKEHGISDPTQIIFEMSKDERKDFYRSVARGLERPLFSVYRRVIRMYDQRNHVGKYTPEDIQKLKELRVKHGTDWATIGAALGRSASSVKDRCRLMRDTCNSGKWMPDEENRLATAVYELTGCKPGDNITTGLSWSHVADQVRTRSEKQCRTKWLNFLNWKQKGGSEWTRDDDITLVIKIAESGAQEETQVDWMELSRGWASIEEFAMDIFTHEQSFCSVRSPQWLRGKWWSLKRHVPDYQLLPFPDVVEYLKNLHSQNSRVRPPRTALQNVDLSKIQVPVIVTGASSDGSGGSVLASDGGTGVVSLGGPVQAGTQAALELVPGLPAGGSGGAGAFLITQPQLNPGIAFAPGQIPTDHIIVHTLPITQAGGVNQQVIIGAVPGQENLVNVANIQGIVQQSDEDLSLPGSVPAAVEVEPETGISNTEMATSLEEKAVGGGDEEEEDAGAGEHAPTLHVQPPEEDIAPVVFEPQVLSGDVTSSDLEGVVCVSTSDMVLAISSPQFVQAPGTLIHMSSLSDPMLTSNDVDLMGSSSDIEAEKVPTGEEVEQDADSPAA